MARALVAGSADGIGHVTARQLVERAHGVTLHARNDQRAEVTRSRVPGAEAAVTGDLATIAAVHSVADQADALGRYDAIVHNASVGYQWRRRRVTADERSENGSASAAAYDMMLAGRLVAESDGTAVLTRGGMYWSRNL